jgi:hypothetical protein
MKTYQERTNELEAQGLCTSDAQAVVDAEDEKDGLTLRILWNGKQVNTASSKEMAQAIVKGTERDYGPLPKGTLKIRKGKS